MRIIRKKMEHKGKSAHSNAKPKTPRHHHHNNAKLLDRQKIKEARRIFSINDAVLGDGGGAIDLFTAIESGSLDTVRRLIENSETPLDINRYILLLQLLCLLISNKCYFELCFLLESELYMIKLVGKVKNHLSLSLCYRSLSLAISSNDAIQ